MVQCITSSDGSERRSLAVGRCLEIPLSEPPGDFAGCHGWGEEIGEREDALAKGEGFGRLRWTVWIGLVVGDGRCGAGAGPAGLGVDKLFGDGVAVEAAVIAVWDAVIEVVGLATGGFSGGDDRYRTAQWTQRMADEVGIDVVSPALIGFAIDDGHLVFAVIAVGVFGCLEGG